MLGENFVRCVTFSTRNRIRSCVVSNSGLLGEGSATINLTLALAWLRNPPPFMERKVFIAVFIAARFLSLSWANWIHSAHFYSVFVRIYFNIIFLCTVMPSRLVFQSYILCTFCVHLKLLVLDNLRTNLKILFFQIPLSSFYFLCFRFSHFVSVNAVRVHFWVEPKT